ncbi:MAG: immunoglobulin-like domain-containing protein [Chitinispirillaceae bacterium]
MKRIISLLSVLCALAALSIYCTDVEFNNILDPEGTNYMPNQDPAEKDRAAADDDGDGIANIHDPDSPYFLDLEPPELRLEPADNPVQIEQCDQAGLQYWSKAVIASDNNDDSLAINGRIRATSDLGDICEVGTYTITYTVEDAAQNADTITRTIEVIAEVKEDTIKPVIELVGDENIEIEQGTEYKDLGATAHDPYPATNLNDRVEVTPDPSTIDTDDLTTYTLTYSVTDDAGLSASVNRTVTIVEADPGVLAPVVELVGGDTMFLTGGTFVEPGYSATDNLGDVEVTVTPTPYVDLDAPIDFSNEYVIRYTATNEAGSHSRKRIVFVAEQYGCPGDDEQAPKITLTGGSTVEVNAGEEWTDTSWSAVDEDGLPVFKEVLGKESLDLNTPGEYELVYRATDLCNNTSEEIRTVIVQ